MKQLIIGLIACMITQTAVCQANSVNEHAKQLLELMGSGKLGVQLMSSMTATFRKQMPAVPAEFWDEMDKEVHPEELVEILVPIYAKNYTDDEIMQLIEFYKTPLGKKVIEKMPLIAQDSYVVGQSWGKKISERVVAKLKEKGYL